MSKQMKQMKAVEEIEKKEAIAETEVIEEKEEVVDLAIIGGGPAGLAAAVAAHDAGVRKMVIIERDVEAGGILNQCIHNGFGLHTFREELTGPEYAKRYIDQVSDRKIEIWLETIVTELSADRCLTLMSRQRGLWKLRARAVILAMGCRERARGALRLPGSRPAGIYTAGTAQRYVNMEGRMPGRRVVILGSGDIGLIMARRMTLEGAKVLAVAELMPFSGGLQRNIVQCLEDFDIPLLLSHTVVNIRGKQRLEAVTLAEVDEQLRPIPGTEREYECDTLLLSCGLLPENELSKQAEVSLHPVTGGPVVDESLQTDVDGIFACGNVLHVHDLVDYVSQEAALAGRQAAAYLQRQTVPALRQTIQGEPFVRTSDSVVTGGGCIHIRAIDGVRYTVPSLLHTDKLDETVTLRFRVGAVYRNCRIEVRAAGRVLKQLRKQILLPAEMEQLVLKKQELQDAGVSELTIAVRQEAEK